MKFAASLLAVAGLATAASAQTLLAFNNFDGGQSPIPGPTVYDSSTLDPTNVIVNPPLGTTTFDGIFNTVGTTFDGPSDQLGWDVFWDGFGRDSPAGTSTTDTQEIGVVTGEGVGGSQGFKIADTDDEGEVNIRFDVVDTTGFQDIFLQFDIFVNDTTYEDSDFLAFTLEEVGVVGSGGQSLITGDNGLEFGLADEPGFVTTTLNFSNPTPGEVFFELAVSFSTDSEFLVIDNVELYGTLIPTPGAAGVLAVAGLAATRRRR
ncbi:MAG: hypothetical protein AAGI30_13885 [Planctomycetota bacterium]